MKRLFTNINTYEFNSQEDFYKSIVEELKGCEWVKENNDKFLCKSVPSMTFYKMTAIDFEYFEVKDINCRYEIIYSKLPDGQYSWEVNFYENEERQYSDYLLIENDDLGLFSSPEEQTEENPIELLKKALILCVEKEIGTSDITSVIEEYDYLYDAIKENVIDNLGIEDLSDSLMEDAAYEYIERCPADCYERAMDNMESYDIKDKIIDYLSDNL